MPAFEEDPMAGRQIANLQGLRGIAALLVVLYHAQPVLNRAYGMSLDTDVGVFGVDIFFVLSGFVMVISNPRPDPATTGRFLAQRFFRIVPLYWLATAAIIACFAIGFRPVGLHHLGPWMVVQSVLFIPSNFPDGRHDLILTVGWTLMFELFFYAALALTFPLRSIGKSVAVLAMLFAALSVVGRIALPLPYLLDFFTAPIMLEFLYGAMLALAYAYWSDAAPRWLAPAGLVLMAAGFAIVIALDAAGVPVPNKHDARFLLLGLPAAVVVGGALAMERGRWILRQPWLLELGAASYVLYLFHALVLQGSIKLVRPLLPQAPVIAGMFALLACLAAALVVHHFIEQPLLDWTKRLMRRRARSDPSLPAPLTIQPAE